MGWLSWMTRVGAAATMMTGLFGSCAAPETDRDPQPSGVDRVGTRVAFWSEDQHERVDVEAVAPDAGVALISTGDEWDAWLAQAPAALGLDGVTTIDLTSDVVVIGSYPRCEASGYVEVESTGATSVLAFGHEQQEPVDCAWSPLTVEVWSIDRAELDGTLELATS